MTIRLTPGIRIALCALILAGASVLLFSNLNNRPLHNDEAVNAWFLQNLVEHGHYKYDPTNYHGPNLYFFQLIPTWLTTWLSDYPEPFSFSDSRGITATSIRAWTALTALLILVLMGGLRRRIGPWGTVAAMAMAATSVDFLFYARYFIHEIYFLFFTLGLYASWVHLKESGKPLYLYTAVFCWVQMLCTKETWFIVFIVLILAALCTQVFIHLINERTFKGAGAAIFKVWPEEACLSRAHWIGAMGLGVFMWAIFYSSFFTNMPGLTDFFKAYAVWTKTGVDSGHSKPFWYFGVKLLLHDESPVLLAAIFGAIWAVRRKNPGALFLTFWFLGVFSAHSLIPYKTPWLVLNILLPMYLLGGYGINKGIQTLFNSESAGASRILNGVFLVLILAVGLWQLPRTRTVVFQEFAEDRHEQVYSHTTNDIFKLVNEIETATAGLNPKWVPIHIYSPTQWPIPFYLMKYRLAGYYGEMKKYLDAPIIIAQDTQQLDLKRDLKEKYRITGITLRPGVRLLLYINDKYLDLMRSAPFPNQDVAP